MLWAVKLKLFSSNFLQCWMQPSCKSLDNLEFFFLKTASDAVPKHLTFSMMKMYYHFPQSHVLSPPGNIMSQYDSTCNLKMFSFLVLQPCQTLLNNVEAFLFSIFFTHGSKLYQIKDSSGLVERRKPPVYSPQKNEDVEMMYLHKAIEVCK